ncbi:MAG: hypothetical protein AB8G05_26200 [Oligoflexales bacterium]
MRLTLPLVSAFIVALLGCVNHYGPRDTASLVSKLYPHILPSECIPFEEERPSDVLSKIRYIKNLPKHCRDIERPQIILIHGIKGSKLQNEAGNNVWPGSLLDHAITKLPFLNSCPVLDKLLDPSEDLFSGKTVMKASGILEEVPITKQPVYKSLVGSLEYIGYIAKEINAADLDPGKDLCELDQIGEKFCPDLWIFNYDWRLSNSFNAVKLKLLIEDYLQDNHVNKMAIQTGQDKSNFSRDKSRFIIIAHSMGNHVAEHYLKTLGGYHKVDKFISISAPLFGAMDSFRMLTKGIEQTCSAESDRRLASRLPSTWELLPWYSGAFVAVKEDGSPGEALNIDLADPQVWKNSYYKDDEGGVHPLENRYIPKGLEYFSYAKEKLGKPIPCFASKPCVKRLYVVGFDKNNLACVPVSRSKEGKYIFDVSDPDVSMRSKEWKKRCFWSSGDGTVSLKSQMGDALSKPSEPVQMFFLKAEHAVGGKSTPEATESLVNFISFVLK